ncbi:MAG TPA: hypothetical protein VKT80_16905, partial [Chloroflexota bacterium]|nr:hypothetical protein [Chloroflexota bacterium]
AERIAGFVAIAGLVTSAIGLVLDRSQFFQSYLVAFLFIFGLSVGGLGYSIVVYLAGGGWGAAIGDVLRSSASLFWLLAILFVPLVLGIPYLYTWANPAVVAADPLLQHKAGWLSPAAWIIRAIIFFAIWIVLSRSLDRFFQEWDRTGDPRPRRSLRNLSGAGMALAILTISFAMFDWVMSLEPDWTSTIFGLMLIAGQALSGWALAIFTLTKLRSRWPVREFASWQVWRDFGSLQLANLIIWAYFSFDQLMLIWIGNLNDEIPWYLRRMNNGWEVAGLFIIVCQFVIPFFSLVLRGTRKSPVALGRVTFLLLVAHFVEDIWLVEPDFAPSALVNHWQDIALVMALGGIWLTFFVRQLRLRLVVVRPAAILAEHVSASAASGNSLTGAP